MNGSSSSSAVYLNEQKKFPSKQQQQKRSYNGHKVSTAAPDLTQASNLDISKEDILEILNSSSNDKFLIKWSNNYSEQALNNQLMKVKPIFHTKIVDYFARVIPSQALLLNILLINFFV